jgi:hypothetical protein
LADVKNSSSLKPFGQMYRNLVGSIYGKSSVAIAYVVMTRKQESPMVAMFVKGSGRKEQWGPSIEASYQVSVNLAEGF